MTGCSIMGDPRRLAPARSLASESDALAAVSNSVSHLVVGVRPVATAGRAGLGSRNLLAPIELDDDIPRLGWPKMTSVNSPCWLCRRPSTRADSRRILVSVVTTRESEHAIGWQGGSGHWGAAGDRPRDGVGICRRR